MYRVRGVLPRRVPAPRPVIAAQALFRAADLARTYFGEDRDGQAALREAAEYVARGSDHRDLAVTAALFLRMLRPA